MTDNLTIVETACAELAATATPITFTAIAEHTGISRTTLYRNPALRAAVDEHRQHNHDPRTITGLTAEISHLRTALEAIAHRVRQHEERLRRLEPTTRRKAN
ncbi:MAG: DUF6262 family protein [Acidimicrobiales bacterium]